MTEDFSLQGRWMGDRRPLPTQPCSGVNCIYEYTPIFFPFLNYNYTHSIYYALGFVLGARDTAGQLGVQDLPLQAI